MVLKGVNRLHNDKTGANGLKRSQLGTQCKNQVKWSWKELIGVHNDNVGWKWSSNESILYTMIKSGQMVLKGVDWVQNDKMMSNGFERSQYGTQW